METPSISSESWQSIVQKFLDTVPKKPLIVIIGPTASGKTAFSIQLSLWLCERGYFPEVINADSRQFYRGLDIGTAKVTQSEMKGIKHHLLSVLDPNEECTISLFQEVASRSIEEIHRAKKYPLLVGGSMLYISAIVDGLLPIPKNHELRSALSKEYDRDLGHTLYQRLLELDPESAASIPRENRTYVIRALEIIETTGKPKSRAVKTTVCPYDLLILGLEIDRELLRKRLIQRTKAMFDAGWAQEVQTLLQRGYDESSPAMQSHGYREIMQALKKGEDPLALQEAIVTKAMQYAKRHQTWWKGDPRVSWIQAI